MRFLSADVVVGFTSPVFSVEEGSGAAVVCIATDSGLREEVDVEVIAFEIDTENNATGVCACVRACVRACMLTLLGIDHLDNVLGYY